MVKFCTWNQKIWLPASQSPEVISKIWINLNMEDKRYFMHSKRYHEQIKKTNDKQVEILTNLLIFLICKELLNKQGKRVMVPLFSFFLNRSWTENPKKTKGKCSNSKERCLNLIEKRYKIQTTPEYCFSSTILTKVTKVKHVLLRHLL